MDKTNCGGCHLFLPDGPGAFTGSCRYFPPQLAVVDGRPTAVRAPTNRDDGCHIGWRPRLALPSPLADDTRVVQLVQRQHGIEP